MNRTIIIGGGNVLGGSRGVSGGGTPIGTANLVVGETPSGTINSTTGSDGNGVYTISAVPLNDANGNPIMELIKTDVGTAVVMVRGVHFNISGLTITYTAGNFPIATAPAQTHRVNFTKA